MNARGIDTSSKVAAIAIALVAIVLGYLAVEGLATGVTRLVTKSGGVASGLEGRLVATAYGGISIVSGLCVLMFLAMTESPSSIG